MVHPDEAWKKADTGTTVLIQVEALDPGAEVVDEEWGPLGSMSGLELIAHGRRSVRCYYVVTLCHATFNSIDSILSLSTLFGFFWGGVFSSSFSSSVLCLSLEVSINVSSDFTTHSLEDFLDRLQCFSLSFPSSLYLLLCFSFSFFQSVVPFTHQGDFFYRLDIRAILH